MHMPWVQLHEDFLERESKIAAALLSAPQGLVIGMGAMLFKFAVELTGTPTKPPDGVFMDPDAGTILEAAMGWSGAPGRAASAFERAGVLEKLEIGYRVRGCDRYLSLWKKNYPDAAAQLFPKPEKDRSDTGPKPERSRTGSGPQDRDQDLDPLPSEEGSAPAQENLLTPSGKGEDGPRRLFDLWNELVGDALPRAEKLTEKRRTQAKARLRELPLPGWREVILQMVASPWCRGETERSSWRATFDFLLQPDTATKVLEGKYDDHRPRGPAPPDRNVGRTSVHEGSCAICDDFGELVPVWEQQLCRRHAAEAMGLELRSAGEAAEWVQQKRTEAT